MDWSDRDFPEGLPPMFARVNQRKSIRGIDFGKEQADTFTRDSHPDLRAAFFRANLNLTAPL